MPSTHHPWLSRLAFVGLLTLVTATGIPDSLLVIIAGGLVFGELQGHALSSVGLLLGSLLLFLASRYRLRRRHAARPRRWPSACATAMPGIRVNYTLFLRFVPVFPFGAVSVALAWLRCPLWLFVMATYLGGTLMLIFETADRRRSRAPPEPRASTFGWTLFLDPQMLMPLGALALLALLPALYRRRRPAATPDRKACDPD